MMRPAISGSCSHADQLPYDIDGVVIKVMILAVQDKETA